MTYILFVYTERSLDTNKPSHQLIDSLISKGWDIKKELTTLDDEFSVWAAINKYWGRGQDVISIEQDIIFTEQQLQHLVDCNNSGANFIAGCSSWFVAAPNSHRQLLNRFRTMTSKDLVNLNEDEYISTMGNWNENKVPMFDMMSITAAKKLAQTNGYCTFVNCGFTKYHRNYQRLPLEKFSYKQGADCSLFFNVNYAAMHQEESGRVARHNHQYTRFHVHDEVQHDHVTSGRDYL